MGGRGPFGGRSFLRRSQRLPGSRRGRWLLDTVGGSLGADQRSGLALVAVWAAVIFKTAGALIPVLACREGRLARVHGPMRGLAWIGGAILTVYGLVLTTVGLLVQGGVIEASKHVDRRPWPGTPTCGIPGSYSRAFS
jgi:hypothetical protein